MRGVLRNAEFIGPSLEARERLRVRIPLRFSAIVDYPYYPATRAGARFVLSEDGETDIECDPAMFDGDWPMGRWRGPGRGPLGRLLGEIERSS